MTRAPSVIGQTLETPMKNVRRWVLAFGIAAAGVMGGAGGVTATTAEDALLAGEDRVHLGHGYEIASHEQDSKDPRDESGSGEKGGKDKEDKPGNDGDRNGGDSSDKGDDDASDVNDTDGPGDDEDD